MSEKALGSDLLKVNVFYNSLMEKTVTDKKDYDMRVGIYSCKNVTIEQLLSFLARILPSIQDGSFFSALGGSLSLWLGISFCALFELVRPDLKHNLDTFSFS